jgi:flagellar hook-length control protein FliK
LGDAEGAASQPAVSLSSSEALSAKLRDEPSIAQSAGARESLAKPTVATSSEGNPNHPATVASITPSSAAFANGFSASGAAQASPDSLPDAAKPFTDRAASRGTNRDATQEDAANAKQVSAVQPAGLDAAASVGLRIPGASPISTPSAAHEQLTGTATAAAAITRDSFSALDFSALDAGTSPGTPAWSYGGSQHAEAGFRDPDLGWVSVRADFNGGGIHATLVPSSAEAAQALNGHLAGLSTHLVEQQSPVTSVTMASPSGGATENGMGQRMQQGAEGNPQGNAPEEAQAGAQGNASRATSDSVVDAPPARAGMRDSFANPGDLRGTHISVMA